MDIMPYERFCDGGAIFSEAYDEDYSII